MRTLGLLGGIASGKSAVAQMLVKRGAVWLDADRTGHEVLREPDVKKALVKHWGKSILADVGEIDRKAVAEIVFAKTPEGAAELKWLEEQTHPRIRIKLEAELEKLRAENVPVAVLDAPVMLKSGWDKLCDVVWFVDTADEVRLRRALQRGWTAHEFWAREAAQEPLAVKRARADCVLDNSGELTYTERQVDRLWQQLIA
jgi:dephospho-CoA kinase